jgi:predicted porin
MDMFGGLTKTSSRIALAAALGLVLGVFAMGTSPAKAADLGGDCCADLEERVAELEATTVRKGNKKVSVTLSGWVVKLGSWWDDGHEQNFYVGDKDTTLSSHFQISGSAQISPGWSAGYTIAVEVPGTSCSVGFAENQFNDNVCAFGDINTLLSYMWIKSDKYGTINWGQLSQATDNVALLPDLSGTIIESNAVLFDGAGMFVRVKGAVNSNDMLSEFAWGAVLTCLSGGGGLAADCNGYPDNAVRYDTPTWAGFSMSTSYGEDDMWDIAVKYAADWNSIKVSAAAGYTIITDEGCSGPSGFRSGGTCFGAVFAGGGGAPFQNARRDADIWQVGASIMHVPSGLWFYGMWQQEENNGTQLTGASNFNKNTFTFKLANSSANENEVWFLKAGIKRTWMPAGATVLWGEWGQYNDMFSGLCGATGNLGNGAIQPTCTGFNPTNFVFTSGPFKGVALTEFTQIDSTEVTRWGLGIVQEIDSAAMHVGLRWQHLELDVSQTSFGFLQNPVNGATIFDPNRRGRKVNTSFEDLDIIQFIGVMFF